MILKLAVKKHGSSLPLYKDYLLLGAIIACFIDIFRDDKYCLIQVAYVLVTMFIYGINYSTSILLKFLKQYWMVSVAFIVWILRDALIGLAPVYIVRTATFFFLLFGGYLFASKLTEKKIESSLKHLVVFINIGILLGLLWFVTNDNAIRHLSDNAKYYVSVTDRLISFWLHPIPAACFSCIGIILSYRLLVRYKVLSIAICTIGLLFTETRSAWLAMPIVILIALLAKMTSNEHTKMKRSTLKRYIVGLALGILLVIIFSQRVNEMINLVSERLFGQDVQSDVSYLWRVNSIILMVGNVFNSNVSSILLGHGLFEGGKLISKTDLSHLFAYNIKTIDNNYISILYDFGLLGFVVIIAVFVISAKGIFAKYKSTLTKTLSYCLAFLLILAFFFEELYWFNIGFLFFTFVGMILGLEKKNEKKTNSRKRYGWNNGFIK